MHLPLFPATSPEPVAGPDVAYTPAALADTILRYLRGQAWDARCPWYYDPHCGAGSFLAAGARLQMRMQGSEIDPAAVALAQATGATVLEEDFLTRRFIHPQTVIVGNPPFSTAPQQLAHALTLRPLAVAWILPAGWLSLTDSLPAAVAALPCATICPIVGRVAYHGPGRDGVSGKPREDALFVWVFDATLRRPEPVRLVWRT